MLLSTVRSLTLLLSLLVALRGWYERLWHLLESSVHLLLFSWLEEWLLRDEGLGSLQKVLVWVKSTDGCKIGQVVNLDHRGDMSLERSKTKLHIVTLWWAWHLVVVLAIVTFSTILVIRSVGLMLLELLWHRWEGDTLWQVWKWVDESSSLFIIMIEGASVTELALTGLLEVLAWLSFVVGVNRTEDSLTKVFGKRIY